MTKIYQYKPKTTTGPNGTTISYRPRLDEDVPRETFLGKLNEYEYIAAPDDWLPGSQPSSIDFKEVTLTPEQKYELRQQHIARNIKDDARHALDINIGDLEDRVADIYKLVEFALVPVCYLLADKSRDAVMTPELVSSYGKRAKAVLDAINSKQLNLRTDYEDPTALVMELIGRVSETNTIVDEKYIQPLKKLGLK